MILFLDDDDDLRENLADVFATFMDEETLLLSSHRAMLDEERALVLACRLAVLDINLGADAPSGLDAYRWLRSHDFAGPIIFLTGHARAHPLVREAERMGDAIVLEKPVTVGQLHAAVQAALQ
ncbi:MAG: response regulator [Kofleriaceae bacterium]|nr:response regulator [Kofleriaceae bacterium]